MEQTWLRDSATFATSAYSVFFYIFFAKKFAKGNFFIVSLHRHLKRTRFGALDSGARVAREWLRLR